MLDLPFWLEAKFFLTFLQFDFVHDIASIPL
jgi:hypothetical protein